MKEPFEENCFYHIYNRSNGNENLFREKTNYLFFMKKYFHYIQPIADTYAFCLLRNHFHIMIRVKELKTITHTNNKFSVNSGETGVNKIVSKKFSNLFNSYAKAYNKLYDRKGSLFQPNVKRKRVNNTSYLTNLIIYIHCNPVKDGYVENLNDWLYSSYHCFLNQKNASLNVFKYWKEILNIEESISWFDDLDNFIYMHKNFDIKKTDSVFDKPWRF